MDRQKRIEELEQEVYTERMFEEERRKEFQASIQPMLDEISKLSEETTKENRMITYEDVKVSDYEIGLTKLIGKQVKEIKGYLSQEFGPDATFKITEIVFEDDTEMDVEGEHDFPYLTQYRSMPQPNFDQETLNRLYEEENGEAE